MVVTINSVPAAIGGALGICSGSSVSLTDASSGGSWSSSDITLATVNTSGVVTGVATGNPVITYTAGNGCYKTVIETVNSSPASIGGSTTVCAGTVTTLTNTVAGGAWSSSNGGFAPITTGGVVTGANVGSVTITYTIGSCKAVLPITVNANTIAAITGIATVCTGNNITVMDVTAGGTWSINNTALATVNASTGIVTGVAAGSAIVTYSLSGCYKTATIPVNGTYPGAISGVNAICLGNTTVLTDTSAAGTWSSTNTTVANVSSTGLVTGSSAGSTNIVYTKNACSVSFPLTVNTNTIASIGGAPLGGVCVGNTITLVDATTGGTWSSNNTSLGSINASTGVLSGVSAGIPTITYTVGGCYKTTGIGVGTPLPAISGSSALCTSTPVTFTDATSGGSWYSSINAKATVNSSGLVTGVSAGTVTISYVKYGCVATMPITVNVCREGAEANQQSLTNGEGVIDYSLYPNPSTGLINIVQSLPTDLTTDARVMNYVGQTVFAGSIEFTGGKSQISLANVVPGIYMIELNDGKGKMTTFRVVIEK